MSPAREALERHQVVIYLAAIAAGSALGLAWPQEEAHLERLIYPALTLLLYASFSQVPFAALREALRDRRFMGALLVANFVAVPLLVLTLGPLLPPDAGQRLGVFLVLLAPCTDWFVAFTHLGKGDVRRAVAALPWLLLLQLILLPVYLWLFLGEAFVGVADATAFGRAFAQFILLPLALAYLTQRLARRHLALRGFLHRLAWWPVPLLALTLFPIAGSHVTAVLEGGKLLAQVVPVFVLYALLAAPLARFVAARFGLPPEAARTLAYSLGSRNSFVVLPLALALPEELSLAVATIVIQSLVELVALTVYLWWVPGVLIPGPGRRP
ncbi:arsenic resistance protein [Thermus sp. FJN-A]